MEYETIIGALVGLGTLAGFLFGAYKYIMGEIAKSEARSSKAATEAYAVGTKAQSDLSEFKVEVAKTHPTNDQLREATQAITNGLDKVVNRMDGLSNQLNQTVVALTGRRMEHGN